MMGLYLFFVVFVVFLDVVKDFCIFVYLIIIVFCWLLIRCWVKRGVLIFLDWFGFFD